MKNYTVGDFQAGENILLVTDSQDIQAVANHCNFDASSYGFLLVKVADNDSWETYASVYASEFLVPAVNCQVNKIV
ncbi:DUF6839 family protein [Mastigocoleus testarum]|uniref:DUF6839 domain-containing protein n=1 Tax=Mastigocoleus testarum BC008 TaxID=371196 RepID=A0A0V7ZGB1_9CYAN|nr:hypothetical protein [Mastigocoleus testarum]KST63490.1 hypothetical protein BC008_13585 [Mastigocoleus testarum BC008]